ncbi:amino acid ABC transporter permease [Rhizobium sp. A37_96]
MTSETSLHPSFETRFWNNPKRRAQVLQCILAVAILLVAFVLVRNTSANLAKLNQRLSFSFLSRSAGFEIAQALIPFSSASNYGRALLVGLLNTVLISALGIVAATMMGLVIGVMRLSPNWIVSRVAAVYIEFFRNIPLLLQIFVWYSLVIIQLLPAPRQAWTLLNYAYLSNRGLIVPQPLPAPGLVTWVVLMSVAVLASVVISLWSHRRRNRTGQGFPTAPAILAMLMVVIAVTSATRGPPIIFAQPLKTSFSFTGGLTIIPELIAMFMALSIYMASYVAEAVRAGMLSVGRGQTEAAAALGLGSLRTIQLIVLPQAMRVILPPLATIYMGLIKNSSLAVAIGYPDLMATGGTILNQTGKAIEIVGIWMVVYLMLSLLTSLTMNWLNANTKLVER